MSLGPQTTTENRGGKAFAPVRLIRKVMALAMTALLAVAAHAQSTSTYKITATLPATIPAGAAGVGLALSGTFPDFSQNTYQVCFYTGSGSAAPITPTVAAGVPTIAVAATTIQAIPPSNFTAANGFAVSALISIVPTGTLCDGTYNAALTNSLSVPIVEPVLTAFAGPSVVPQTNPTTDLQAPPTIILLAGSNFAANTTVSFQDFPGAVTRVLTPNSLSVTVPAAFAASSSDTTSNLSICNSGSSSATFCSSTDPPFTVSLSPLYPSAGFLTVTPNPTTTAEQTTLTAQFSKGDPANPLPEPGAPSGTVSFSAGSTTIPPAKLLLDPTATFVQQVSTVTTPITATPTITPPAGSYLNSVTISIADAAPGATIYYTQDGSTPTSASTAYTAPFQITASQTIKAIAASSGALNSAVSAAAYTITISPPTKLAFAVQPANTAINTAIAPAIQVAIQDVNGNTVTTSTLPVTIALATNPGQSTLAGTMTVNAVNGLATFSDLTLNNVAAGYTLNATSGNLTSASSNAFNITPYPITMTVQSALIGINSTLNGTLTLGHAAPQGGTVVTLSSDTPANVTISPATLTIPAGQTVGNFTYTGVAAGNATLSAAATNYQTGTIQVTGTAAQVSLGTIPPVAPGQAVSLALSLPTAAPPGGTTVTFTSSNTGVATVTSSIFVPAGQRTAATNPQITGIIIGTTNIVASAPGYAPDTRNVTVTVVASFNPNATNLNLITSTNTTLNLAAPAPRGGIAFTLTSDDPTIATIASPVTVAAGATSVPVSITGVGNGSTTIRANSPGVTEATGSVNINSAIQVGTVTTGVKMQYGFNLYLPVTPSVPTNVTVTMANPAIGTISNSTSTIGTQTITIPNVTSNYIGYFVLQGQSQGNTTLSVSAPGYTTGTGTMSVYPSGFSYYPYYSNSFTTSTFSSPTGVNLYTAIFDPTTGNFANIGLQLNPGIPDINVPVTSSNTSVGTIVTNPVVFHAQGGSASTTFQPSSAGTTNLTIGTPPAPFSVPTYSQQLVATVTTPAIQAFSSYTGVNLENQQYLYLPVAPPSTETVTITSNNPELVLLSTDPAVAGVTTLNIPTTNGTIGTIYLQGQAAGNATLTVSAPGYISGTDTITVYPTGFTLYYYYGNYDFSTLTTSGPTAITIYPSTLDPTSLAPNSSGLSLSPGVAPVNVTVSSATTSVGTLSPTTLTFTAPTSTTAGTTSQSTNFQPVAAGTSVVSIATPTGYTTPSNHTSLTATVTAPTRTITFNGDLVTGVKLENYVYLYLSSAPPSPLNVTVTTNNPAVATVSTDGGSVGTTSTTFTNVTGTFIGYVYVQGQSQGATTLTATATGYSSASNNITIYPSGFGFSYYNGNINTTTFSSASGLNIYPEILNPGDLTVYGYPQTVNPGLAPINVSVISSAPSVGTITTSPVVFNAQATSAATAFQPISAGSSNITLSTPAGFSTPSNYNALSAVVTAPTISVNNVETGLNLETAMYISLPQTPPNPVTVTVTSNGPQIAVISKDGTVIGGTTLTFTNVTSTGVGYIYIQGASLGTTTITVSAPGYNNGNGSVTVDPSGFSFYGGTNSFTTSATSSPTTLTVYVNTLTPGTLNVIQYYNQLLAPQAGTVNVPITSSNTATGTITSSPLVFTPGTQAYQQTGFQPVATGTSVLTAQPPSGFSNPSQAQQITATVQ